MFVFSFILILRYSMTTPTREKKNTEIIPNIVHYIIFDQNELNFISYLSILSVLKFHQPEFVYIHSNQEKLAGYYWEQLRHSWGNVELKYLVRPTHVYGRLLSSVYHSSDVSRINILQTFGGIYLDTDMLILKNLNEFLKYEMTVGWPKNEYFGTQILIASKSARFLKFWMESYQHYRPTQWYYNAGQLPTEKILVKYPDLVHRVEELFGVQNLLDKLYSEESVWPEWKEFYAIHLLSRHDGAPQILNETIVQKMRVPFGEIARHILYS